MLIKFGWDLICFCFWSQWLLASQAVLENAREGIIDHWSWIRFYLRYHHDHDTRGDHDDRDNLHRMTHSLLRGLRTSSFIQNLTLFHCFFCQSSFFAWSGFPFDEIRSQNRAPEQSRRSRQSWSRTSWTSWRSRTCNTGRGSLEQRHHRPPWKEGLLIDSWIALHNKGHLLQTKPWKLFNWQVVNSLRSSSRNMLKTCDGNRALCCGQNTQKWTECIKITMRMKRIDKGKKMKWFFLPSIDAQILSDLSDVICLCNISVFPDLCLIVNFTLQPWQSGHLHVVGPHTWHTWCNPACVILSMVCFGHLNNFIDELK